MLFRVNWRVQVSAALKSLPVYLLLPTLLVGIPVNLLAIVTGKFSTEFANWNSVTMFAFYVGLCLWLIRQAVRGIGMLRYWSN